MPPPDSQAAGARDPRPGLLAALARLLPRRPGVVIDGVRYVERFRPGALRIGRARVREYDVRFPDGDRARIRCTPRRQYADLVGDWPLIPYRVAATRIRPGMRILDARCGTGCGAALLAEAVGPSGAVVALETDGESIRYARRRYPAPVIAFELDDHASLHGELDGAFDAVVAVGALRAGADHAADAAELWRVVAPGGWLLLVAPTVERTARDDDEPGRPAPLDEPALLALLRDLPDLERAVQAAALGAGRAGAWAFKARPEAPGRD
ncbi:MAG: methyltransferase domain-containing protein [Leptolyngbya sp. PLA2]|nr:methyltransferase domain-containing protein [Leptolyngbya sp.]MCE7971622.1 methyltransferase domain-containing protein [Leptolyngbya sp. PL-A2]MCQ3940058.1 hypothetical protein [cyanobacterium CYA1]MDL1903200.1 methyltransferase domain-containing protein [Synechococcales cyanobacterium CNB]GIK17897.1 MAG: hypothetical protein BroJett004_00610 [Planctomycetota bacterium]